ncbi:MAG: YigZ family protein [Bacteroidetes bacterium]|nr:YigZ family protein [Bacteroidota bacterium]
MLFDDSYKTIASKSEGLYKEKGSKFISFAMPVSSETEIKEFLDQTRKQFHDARHVCYAYILGFDKSTYRMNDDGEPSGTAGRPIYGQLQSFDLTNTIVAVVRYFGGTKLGVSGLINAYKLVTLDALAKAEILTKRVTEIYEIVYDYALMNDVMKIMKDENLNQLSTSFGLECKISFPVAKNDSTRVYEKLLKVDTLKIKHIQTI